MTIIRWLAIFLVLGSSFGFASDKKAKAGGSPSGAPDDRVAFHGTIVTFEKSARMFTLKGKKEMNVYVISDSTKIMKGPAQGSLDDLAAGVYVRGAARPRAADGRFDALTLKIELKTGPVRVEKAERAENKPMPEASP